MQLSMAEIILVVIVLIGIYTAVANVIEKHATRGKNDKHAIDGKDVAGKWHRKM